MAVIGSHTRFVKPSDPKEQIIHPRCLVAKDIPAIMSVGLVTLGPSNPYSTAWNAWCAWLCLWFLLAWPMRCLLVPWLIKLRCQTLPQWAKARLMLTWWMAATNHVPKLRCPWAPRRVGSFSVLCTVCVTPFGILTVSGKAWRSRSELHLRRWMDDSWNYRYSSLSSRHWPNLLIFLSRCPLLNSWNFTCALRPQQHWSMMWNLVLNRNMLAVQLHQWWRMCSFGCGADVNFLDVHRFIGNPRSWTYLDPCASRKTWRIRTS